jgi:hypothetical protein
MGVECSYVHTLDPLCPFLANTEGNHQSTQGKADLRILRRLLNRRARFGLCKQAIVHRGTARQRVWAASRSPAAEPDGSSRGPTPCNGAWPVSWAAVGHCGVGESGVNRAAFVHTAEVAGSKPATPTLVRALVMVYGTGALRMSGQQTGSNRLEVPPLVSTAPVPTRKRLVLMSLWASTPVGGKGWSPARATLLPFDAARRDHPRSRAP